MHVLHLEDSANDAELIADLLTSEWPQCRITRVATRRDYEQALQRGGFDVVVSDYSLPGFDGLAALELAQQYCPDNPFIFLSGTIGEERAVEALKSGATDYVLKDRPARLAPAIRAALGQRDKEQWRQRTEEALRRNQELFRQITENVADLIAVLDLAGRWIYANPAYQLLGDPEQLKGTDSLANVHPADRDGIKAVFRDTARSGRGQRADYRLILPDGNVRHLESQIGVISDRDGQIARLLVVSRDVTEEKAAVAEIVRQRSFLRKVIDLDRNFIFAKDREGRFILANHSVAAFYGTTVEALLGRTEADFSRSPAEAERSRRDDLRVIETLQESRATELPATDAAGNLRWFDLLRHPLAAEAGQPAAMLGFGVEVTERRIIEQRLREQASLLDKSRDAIAVTDLAHRITYWNPSAERLYGWSAAEALGQDLRQLMFVFDAERFATARSNLIAAGEWRGELRPTTKSGKTTIVESTWSLVSDAAFQPGSILCIDTDVTEQRRLTLQLERAQRLESIGMLAGGIAHDLNNALAPILMGTEMLRMSVQDSDAITLLNTLENSALHGASLVRQVLAFSRGAEGEKGSLQLRHVLVEVEQFLQQTLERNITIRVRTERNLPPVLADATQIKQVLLNLSVNARDAMPNGGMLELAAVSCSVAPAMAAAAGGDARPGPHVQLSIKDTGSGIPPEIVDRIFDPFFTTKQPGKGTGLGLSIVHGVVKGHGGFMQVESRVGSGTTFHLYLPVAEAPARDRGKNAPAPLLRSQGDEVLVIDDDAGVRTVVEALLAAHGYRVRVAGNGQAGLAELRRPGSAVNVVLTDLMMPGLSGSALVEAIQQTQPGLPVIVMSGLGEAGALPPGVPLLAKPLTVQQLLETLQHALQSAPDG